QLAVDIAVAVAGPGLARADAAQHRAGVADDDVVGFRGSSRVGHHSAARRPAAARMAARTRSGVAGRRGSRAPVAGPMAPRVAGAVGTSAGSPMPLAP